MIKKLAVPLALLLLTLSSLTNGALARQQHAGDNNVANNIEEQQNVAVEEGGHKLEVEHLTHAFKAPQQPSLYDIEFTKKRIDNREAAASAARGGGSVGRGAGGGSAGGGADGGGIGGGGGASPSPLRPRCG